MTSFLLLADAGGGGMIEMAKETGETFGFQWWLFLSQILSFLIVAILLYVPAIRLAFSTKNGRELLPMLKYSARSQLQLGALLALVLVFRIGI